MGGRSSADLSGPNSCLNKIQVKEQGFSQSCTAESLQTTITYESRKPVLTGRVWTPSNPNGAWKCGSNDANYGRLDSINIQQGDGPFFTATLTYTQPLSSQIIINIGDDNTEATMNSLTVKMLSLPLEKNKNYAYTWNHMLIGLSGYGPTDALWHDISGILSGISRQTAIDYYNNNSDCMRWINDISQLPTDPEKRTVPPENEGDEPTVENFKWYIMYDKTKPGVEYYQIPTYEITEYTKHNGRNNAAWAAAQRSGKLKFPTYGDFGLTNYYYGTPPASCYYWLCQGGDIHYDGKYWVAQCTYIWSPEPTGWDTALYDVATDKQGNPDYGANYTKNSIFSIGNN